MVTTELSINKRARNLLREWPIFVIGLIAGVGTYVISNNILISAVIGPGVSAGAKAFWSFASFTAQVNSEVH